MIKNYLLPVSLYHSISNGTIPCFYFDSTWELYHVVQFTICKLIQYCYELNDTPYLDHS
jgi:hypothetical protein